MKKVAASMMMLAFAATSAFGGTVRFDADVVELDIRDMPATVSFDLYITHSGNGWESVDMLVGSDGVPMDLSSWAYSQAFIDATLFQGAPKDQTVYTYGIDDLGGFSLAARPGEMLIGTLTVNTGALGLGTYTINVDTARDGGESALGAGTELEPLVGFATINVTPEPATLILLGIGGVAAMRRRRR